jgi:hypothetical protein
MVPKGPAAKEDVQERNADTATTTAVTRFIRAPIREKTKMKPKRRKQDFWQMRQSG